MSGRESRLVHRGHRPIPFFHVLCLSFFEMIEGPEDGEPPLIVGTRHAGEMRRVDHQHRMELETQRPRLHVANAGQEQRRDHLAIARPLLDFGRHFLQQLLSRRIFHQADQRLDLVIEPHDLGVRFRFLRTHPRKPLQKSHLRHPRHSRGRRGGEERAARERRRASR